MDYNLDAAKHADCGRIMHGCMLHGCMLHGDLFAGTGCMLHSDLYAGTGCMVTYVLAVLAAAVVVEAEPALRYRRLWGCGAINQW